MNKLGKLTIRDLISIIMLSILMIIIFAVVSSVTAVNHFVNLILSPGIWCFICGIIFVLMVNRVKKKGVFFLSAAVFGLFYVFIGYWYVTIYFIIAGILGELFMKKEGSYENRKKVTGVWTAYSVWFAAASMLPILFIWDAYVAAAYADGWSTEYIDVYFNYYTSPMWLIIIFAGSALCGYLGCKLGGKLMKKHFNKTGIV